MRNFYYLSMGKGGWFNSDWFGRYHPRAQKRYLTNTGRSAKAPVLGGAPGLTTWFEGPPEVLPGGDTVLASVTVWMVTVLTFQVLLGKRFKKSFWLVYVVVPEAGTGVAIVLG